MAKDRLNKFISKINFRKTFLNFIFYYFLSFTANYPSIMHNFTNYQSKPTHFKLGIIIINNKIGNK